jgi:RimJ/RimL family protein N-acetyltransferase
MSAQHATEPVITTERLSLHHISVPNLIRLYESPENADFYDPPTLQNPYRDLIDESGPLQWRVPDVQRDPSLNKWFVRWIVQRADNCIVGSTAFHAAPNALGMIEIGIGIQPAFQRRGFAREALLAMWRWVINQDGVSTLRYTVDPSNTPSVRIINNFGFHHVAQQIDEIDGPEDVYELSTSEFRTKFC